MGRWSMSFFVLLVTSPTWLAAQESIGTLKSLRGTATLERATVKRPVLVGDELHTGDRILTGADGFTSVSFRDQSSLAIGPNSDVDLSRYRFDASTHQGEQHVRLRSGSLAAISGKMAKASPDGVRFNAGTMTLGVRGTRFIADLQLGVEPSPGFLRDGQGRIVRSFQGLCWLAGINVRVCPADRYVLLPDLDGRVGEISLSAKGESIMLTGAFTGLEIDDQGSRRIDLSETQVQSQYGALLAALPPAPKTFILRFEAGTSDRLTSDSETTIAEIRQTTAGWPVVPNVDVVGHTDTTGSSAANDALSLQRARSVSRWLDSLSLPGHRLHVSGRGKRQLLVQTPDETAEPRNRRVEITVY